MTSRLAALSRLVSNYSEKSQPIFQALNKGNAFEWSEDYQSSFKGLKRYLASPPLLAKPEQGERLLLYLTVSPTALSAVLVLKTKDVSKALFDAETQYTQLEKLALALVMASKKL